MPKSKVRKKAKQNLDRVRKGRRAAEASCRDRCCPQPPHLSGPNNSPDP